MRDSSRNFIQGAVKRPGRVKNAARRDGISVGAEARKMAGSPNKSRAAAGRLALRFKGIAKHGNIRHGKGSSGRTGKYTHRKRGRK